MTALFEMTGLRFGMLRVLGRDLEKTYANRKSVWRCICDCGQRRSILGDSLRTKKTRSCGCLFRRGGWRIELKSHCRNGHEYTADNTILWPSKGTRACRACYEVCVAKRLARMRRQREALRPKLSEKQKAEIREDRFWLNQLHHYMWINSLEGKNWRVKYMKKYVTNPKYVDKRRQYKASGRWAEVRARWLATPSGQRSYLLRSCMKLPRETPAEVEEFALLVHQLKQTKRNLGL